MYRLIASDLDGTLLSSDKTLSEDNRHELNRAFHEGAVIVPATGRVFAGLPDFLKNADWFRYCILSNGAQVYDAFEDNTVYRSEISPELSVKVLEFADRLPVLYDIYAGGKGFMTAGMLDRCDDVVEDIHYRDLIHRLRAPVNELKEFILSGKIDVQKIQFYFRVEDAALRLETFPVLEEKFPELFVSSSVPFNIEINSRNANKGAALEALCNHLGINLSEAMAFGDNSNDITMLQRAGMGVCMENGTDEAKASADYITGTNDTSGVARAIRKFI